MSLLSHQKSPLLLGKWRQGRPRHLRVTVTHHAVTLQHIGVAFSSGGPTQALSRVSELSFLPPD